MKVSVITPTANRPEMLQRCIEQFLSQDWEDKEMIIIQDGWHQLTDICQVDTRIRLVEYEGVKSIGEKRNDGITFAQGGIILHMDDDDIYASDYITKSVNFLLESKADLVGLNNFHFCDNTNGRAFEYNYKGGQKAVAGATMCFWRKTWEHHKFEDVNEGEDALFCAKTLKIAYGDYKNSFVAIRHGANTGRISYNSSEFTEVNPKIIEEIYKNI